MIDWERISQEHGPLVWRTAYRLLGGGADAADCFQETFLSALDVSRRQEVRNWPGLLQRLATARALDLMRRRRKRASVMRQSEIDLELAPAQQRSPSHRMEDEELQAQLREALTHLPESQSEVFCLRHLNELSYEEIAVELGTTVDNVGVLLHRAKARLRDLLTAPQRVPAVEQPR